MSASTSPQFPCEFPIKVMGRQGGELCRDTRRVIEQHTGPLAETLIRVRTSTDGNFLAVTYLIQAQSRAQLDQIYRELTACKSVLMAL